MAYQTAKGKAPKLVTVAGAAAFAVLVGATNVAQAQGGYVGASFGQSDYDGISDSPTAFKIFGGYNFNKNLGIEATWYNFGEAEDGPVTVEVDGIGFTANGYLPLNDQASLFGKVGLVMWDADVTVSGLGSGSDDGTDLVIGIGFKWNFSKQAALRVEYENVDVDDGDISLISVGVSFNF